jgi:hypothetical protein
MGPRRIFCGIFLLTYMAVTAQAATRLAILPANGQFGKMENRVVDSLTGRLAGKDGLTIIDRASIDRILKEQNFQNSDRSSLDTAARIGKLVGARQIVMIQVISRSYNTHREGSNADVKTFGTVTLQASARVIDVETAVILGQPSSRYEDSALINETRSNRGIAIGPYARRPSQSSEGSDPKAVETQEWQKAVDAVTAEIAPGLINVLASAPAAKAEMPLVAGIANGSVFINEGASSGIKVGDRFEVVRKVDVGLKDPKTGQPITQKQKICVLTVTTTDEGNSSGTCQGGLPRSGDVAEPMRP